METRAARQAGVDPRLLHALIQQESGGRVDARSPSGALGPTQLMPGTARGLGVDPNDPMQNLLGGARYLRQQLDRFHSVPLALSAYNSGPGGSEASGRVEGIPETQGYVRSIMSMLGGQGGAPSAPAAQPTFGSAPQPDARRQFATALLGAIHGGKLDTGGLIGALQQRRETLASSPSPEMPGLASALAPSAPANAPEGGTLSYLTPFADRFGLKITSTDGGKHTPTSYHYKKRAVDLAGSPDHMLALARYALAHPQDFTEMFYDPAGAYVKNGRVVKGAIGDHSDHVHIGR